MLFGSRTGARHPIIFLFWAAIIMRGAQKGDSERGSWPFERWVLDQDPSPRQRCGPPDEGRDYAWAGFRLQRLRSGDGRQSAAASSSGRRRGYDSDKIREDIESRNALPMIPMRKNRKVCKVVDMTIYTLRNMDERCFNKLKNSRRLATRYDKTADSLLGFIDIACLRLWLRHLSTRPSVRAFAAELPGRPSWPI